MIPTWTVLLLTAVIGTALALDVTLLVQQFKNNLDKAGTLDEMVDRPPKESPKVSVD